MKLLERLIAIAALVPTLAFANVEVPLDTAPIDTGDMASLQNGAKLFVNHCLNCHAASHMRYNRLTDLGLTEQQIKDNLMFTTEKIGEHMKVAMDAKDAAKWFGAQPPDLSVVARSRGADWLYTYLRTFYRDDTRTTGWNNVAFPNVGMPHVLAELQGELVMEEHKAENKATEGEEGAHGASHEPPKLVLAQAGSMTLKQYDAAIADLVNYLVYMGEPARNRRVQIGMMTLLFLGVLLVFAYVLKKEYWKDVH